MVGWLNPHTHTCTNHKSYINHISSFHCYIICWTTQTQHNPSWCQQQKGSKHGRSIFGFLLWQMVNIPIFDASYLQFSHSSWLNLPGSLDWMGQISTRNPHWFGKDHAFRWRFSQPMQKAQVLPMASERKSLGLLPNDLRGLCGAVDAGSGYRERRPVACTSCSSCMSTLDEQLCFSGL